MIRKIIDWFNKIDDESYQHMMHLLSGALCAGFAFGALLIFLYAFCVGLGVI